MPQPTSRLDFKAEGKPAKSAAALKRKGSLKKGGMGRRGGKTGKTAANSKAKPAAEAPTVATEATPEEPKGRYFAIAGMGICHY